MHHHRNYHYRVKSRREEMVSTNLCELKISTVLDAEPMERLVAQRKARRKEVLKISTSIDIGGGNEVVYSIRKSFWKGHLVRLMFLIWDRPG